MIASVNSWRVRRRSIPVSRWERSPSNSPSAVKIEIVIRLCSGCGRPGRLEIFPYDSPSVSSATASFRRNYWAWSVFLSMGGSELVGGSRRARRWNATRCGRRSGRRSRSRGVEESRPLVVGRAWCVGVDHELVLRVPSRRIDWNVR